MAHLVLVRPLTDEQAKDSPIRSLPVRFRQVRHCWSAPPFGHCLSLQELPSLLRWTLHCYCGQEGASRHHEERLFKVVQVLEALQAWLLRQVRLQPFGSSDQWPFVSISAASLNEPTGLKLAVHSWTEESADYWSFDPKLPRRRGPSGLGGPPKNLEP